MAPDGSLYFMDWSQMLIGHLQHHLRDPNRDHQHGRIYRITYPGRPLLTPKKIARRDRSRTCSNCSRSPRTTCASAPRSNSTRTTPKQVIAAVQKWEKALDKKDKDYEHHRLEALWVHQWHNVVNLDLLNDVLKSPDPRARAQAVRVLCYWRDRVPNALALLVRPRSRIPRPRVRLEAVRALSFFRGSRHAARPSRSPSSSMAEKDYYIDYCFKETMKQLGSLPGGQGHHQQGSAARRAPARASPTRTTARRARSSPPEDRRLYDLGKEVFNREAHCVTCHQADGKGVESIYPGLAKSEWLAGRSAPRDQDRAQGALRSAEVPGQEIRPAKKARRR